MIKFIDFDGIVECGFELGWSCGRLGLSLGDLLRL